MIVRAHCLPDDCRVASRFFPLCEMTDQNFSSIPIYLESQTPGMVDAGSNRENVMPPHTGFSPISSPTGSAPPPHPEQVPHSIAGRWESSQVLALLEVKREEWEEYEQGGSPEQGGSGAARWDKCSEKLKLRGFIVVGPQCKSEWDMLLSQYKRIREWNSKSGNEAYRSLSVSERERNQLPEWFEEQWYTVLESLYGSRPCVETRSMAESLPRTDNLDESDGPSSDARTACSKRKRGDDYAVDEVSKAVTDGMQKLAQILLRMEEKRVAEAEAQEQKRVELEKIWLDQCERHNAELASVLKVMVTAYAELAKKVHL